MQIQSLEIGGPCCGGGGGLWCEGRSSVCEVGLFELERTRCGVLEGVEVGVCGSCSWVGGAESLEVLSDLIRLM